MIYQPIRVKSRLNTFIEISKALIRKKSPLCFYDGMKIRVTDPEYIAWLRLAKQQSDFKFTNSYNARTGQLVKQVGKYENMEIEIHLSRKEWVVDISGSIHKFFNDGEYNYDDFYFDDFLKAVDNLVAGLNLDISQCSVVNIEIGINCIKPAWLTAPILVILQNILSLDRDYKNKVYKSKKGYQRFGIEKTNWYFKIYDKGLASKLVEKIMRFEFGFTRSREVLKRLNIVTLEDLKCIEVLVKAKEILLTKLTTIQVNHPDLLSRIPLREIENNREVVRYGDRFFWSDLKKSRSRYKEARGNMTRLVNLYCDCNLEQQIINMVCEKLQ
jgi:hypothetical protein